MLHLFFYRDNIESMGFISLSVYTSDVSIYTVMPSICHKLRVFLTI